MTWSRRKHSLGSKTRLAQFLLLAALVWCLASSFVTQTYAADSQSTVTATIADNAGPTTPILIAPNNNSYVTTTTPSFVWTASTDDNGIGHYELSLDGSTLFSSIPTSATSNSSYTLTYNSGNQEYTLVPATSLTQGSHTWKVRAVDTLGNGTDSATWSFTVDTQAPSFVISQIGTASVSISAQDLSTIPSSPLVLTANEPLLTAAGEANSTVQLTVTIPSSSNQSYSVAIASNGTWSQQLGILPRDVTITLDFTITDLAGNVSVLNGVTFTIPTPVITFPPTSPSPSPSPEATPEATPGVTPSPSPSPSPSPEAPLITIPVLPPKEIAAAVSREVAQQLETPIAIIEAIIPPVITSALDSTTRTVAPYSAAILTSAVPLVATAAVASQFGTGLSIDLLIKILQALGLLRRGKKQGIVYDQTTDKPVPFALITITGINKEQQVLETVVTDTEGVYRGIKLPAGVYQLSVSHQDYTFPTKIPKPIYVQANDYYMGETFEITAAKAGREEQLFLIPVDPVATAGKNRSKVFSRLGLARVSSLTGPLLIPLFVISGVMLSLSPSIWNSGVFLLYCVYVGLKARTWFQTPNVVGTVVTLKGEPIDDAILRVIDSETNELVEVTRSKPDGKFDLSLKPGSYQLSVMKPGYVWNTKDATLSFHQIIISAEHPKEVQSVAVQLTEASSIYKELFG